MDKPIQVVKLVKAADLAGGIKTTEELVSEVFAAMDDLSGNETVEGKVMHIVKRSYTIRHDDDIAVNGKNYIVKDGAVKFKILNVAELGRECFLVLTVENYE